MQIEKTKARIKCDVSGCGNISDYTIVNKKIVFDGNIYMCEKCFKELYRLIGEQLIPASPTPIYKKQNKGAKNV